VIALVNPLIKPGMVLYSGKSLDAQIRYMNNYFAIIYKPDMADDIEKRIPLAAISPLQTLGFTLSYSMYDGFHMGDQGFVTVCSHEELLPPVDPVVQTLLSQTTTNIHYLSLTNQGEEDVNE
jgi:hypothetical protein